MAEINEENNEVDPYESLAAAMSGNTGGAYDAREDEVVSDEVSEVQADAETVEAQPEPAPEATQETSTQPSPTKAQEMQLHPTNAGQAQTWFKVEGLVDKLDIHDLAGLQLAQKENPNNFTAAQLQQVKDLSWKKIQDVANRKDKLEVKDYKGFESLLQNVPADYRMETSKELGTIKSAETRLYRARNGIEDKSLSEKAKDNLDKAKVSGTKVLQQSKTGLKKAFDTGLKKLDNGFDKIDAGLDKIDAGIDKIATRLSNWTKSKPTSEATKEPFVKAQEMQLHPTNAGQAQTWFKVEGLVDKLDIHDLAGLQLAQKENPNNFTAAQLQQVKDLSWKKIQNVANRKHKLEVKDYKGFESLLQNVPASYRMETSKELGTIKSAETRLHRARNGIEDKSLGEKAKDNLDKAKVSGAKVLQQSKTGLKKAFIAGLNKIDKGMDKIDNAIDNGLNKIDDGVDKMVIRLGKFGKSVSAYAYKKTDKALGFIKNNKVVRGTKKTINGVKKAYNSTINFGKKTVNGVKNAYQGTIKFGKDVYKVGQEGVKAVKDGYKKTKDFFKKDLTDKEMAVKLSKGNLDKLTPEQIAFAYKTLKDIDQRRDPHSKEVNALYAIKGFADRKMDAISADKSILTAGNAQQAAEWLNISQHVQDTVNHNRVEAKNERNNNVALALQSYGLDTKMVTAAEKQEAATKTDVNSDTQEQAAKQEMINTSPENVVLVQKNEQEAETSVEISRLESNPKELESQDKRTIKELSERSNTTIQTPKKEAGVILDSEALSAALSGNTGTAVNAMDGEKPKAQPAPAQAPAQPVYDSEALSAALSGNTGTAVNAMDGEKPKAQPAPAQAPTQPVYDSEALSAALSGNTGTAVNAMDGEKPKAQAPGERAATPKRDETKKKLTKKERGLLKALEKSGHLKIKKSTHNKESKPVVRELNPNIKNLVSNNNRSA